MPAFLPHRLVSRCAVALPALLLSACAALNQQAYQREHGAPDPQRYDQAQAMPPGGVSYQQQIKPLLQSRCVVCHACYDAPCQLKLGSWEGIARGLSSTPVYDGTRLRPAEPTRLFTDAQVASQWRERGFQPVLNEFENTPQAMRSASLLYRSLLLKQEHPLPAVDVLPAKSFDFSMDRAQSCPRIENFEAHAKAQPLAGMPYGLPGISAEELNLVARWLEAGAPDDGAPTPTATEQREVIAWEKFLNNGGSNKERLMSRYLYEHLFLGHLYLSDETARQAYKLVRSSTPPGQAIAPIATRRPFDDPGSAPFYYRLQRDLEPIVAKTHMPYRFDAARRERYRALFLKPRYEVAQLPSYEPTMASNGLASFQAMPSDARYRFLLDDAQFFIMNFIKGPVCRGQVALNVIEDRFWVFFTDPDSSLGHDASELVLRAGAAAGLPAAQGSDASVFDFWTIYAKQEKQFQREKAQSLSANFAAHGGPTLNMVWDGDLHNPNAALTVFRQFESASVVQGLVGDTPKTAWVIGYPLFERIFYLLAAGFDVYGDIGHQLHSRLFMDFLRMEGESNFINLLPRAARPGVVAHWYRQARPAALEQMQTLALTGTHESAIPFKTADPKTELLSLLAKRIGPALPQRWALQQEPNASLRRDLAQLAALRGPSLGWLPATLFMEVSEVAGPPRYFSLLRELGHLNMTRLLREEGELLPAENALTVANGLIGAYPNVLLRVKASEVAEFSAAVAALSSEADYRRLADRWAVRRSNPDFWAASDALHRARPRLAGPDGGLFDYNRLENR